MGGISLLKTSGECISLKGLYLPIHRMFPTTKLDVHYIWRMGEGVDS